jgi:signal transduction histidine kinase
MNILTNAGDALLSEKSLLNKQIIIHTEKLGENQIRIKIRDNGVGIPLEFQAQIFDPFFTTKPIGKGTGLGLSICYKIIEKHSGTITVTSEVGKGTEFAITLPIR